jgi:outer membrane protein assembly factor BamB
VATEERTYLELSQDEGTAHKFYEVIVNGTLLKIRYGRIGTDGQSSEKTFSTEEKARAEGDKKIKSKKKKGYEEAVMGVRKKRSITRRAVTSAKSKSKQSPVIWKLATGSTAFGIFVDEDGCWVGNQDGKVFCVDHDGTVRRQFKLPEGVKCIVADEDWRYAGCDDGNVYDLNGKVPTVAYTIAEDVDIYWIDINDGVLGVADDDGYVTTINHEDESQWRAKSKGTAGWMVRCDEIGVYHGHTDGVTMYDWEDGTQIWHQATPGQVLFGWQEESTVYAATSNNKVAQFTKQGTQGKVFDCDASVYSCSATEDGKYVFAGDSSSSIYCFDENGERKWKLGTGCGSALSMQYFGGRLYVVSTEGSLICIDATESAIRDAEQGTVPEAKAIAAPKKTGAEVTTAIETTSDDSKGVVVECYKKGTQLRVRAVSEGYDATWNVQFPKNIREDGVRYVVEELRVSARGTFYRAFGEIKRLAD